MKCFEAHHQLGDFLNKAAILFNQVIQIVNLAYFNNARFDKFYDRTMLSLPVKCTCGSGYVKLPLKQFVKNDFWIKNSAEQRPSKSSVN
jgi:hypothetical protein